MEPAEHSAVVAVEGLVSEVQQQHENTDAIIDSVIEHANERVAAAEAVAEQIAEAAIESERGRKIHELENETWDARQEIQTLKFQMQEMTVQLSEVMQGLSSLTTLQVASQQMGSSSLIPPQSEGTIQEATAEVMEILPANLENVVEENPVPVPPVPQKRKRWI